MGDTLWSRPAGWQPGVVPLPLSKGAKAMKKTPFYRRLAVCRGRGAAAPGNPSPRRDAPPAPGPCRPFRQRRRLFPGGRYVYERELSMDAEAVSRHTLFYFEGIDKNAGF